MLGDDVFDRQYETTMESLEILSQNPLFDIEQVKGELKTLITYEDLDWTGRGMLKSSEISGTILAYQAFIMRYEKDHGGK